MEQRVGQQVAAATFSMVSPLMPESDKSWMTAARLACLFNSSRRPRRVTWWIRWFSRLIEHCGQDMNREV